MSEPVLRDLQHAGARHAAARSRAFQVFAAALAYPEGEVLAAIREGTVAVALTEALREVAPELLEGIDAEALADGGADDDALAVEYTRLFDVGPSGPPCPLYGGLYGGARMKVMEEALRFYNHFGLRLAADTRELPDHLLTELEFLHYLAFREAEALERGEDAGPWQRGQRDFLARHPARFLPRLLARLEASDPPRYLRELMRLLGAFVAHEADRLREVSGPPPA